MDDAKIVFQGRKTILEMLIDRGYNIPDEYNKIELDTFRYLYNNEKSDIICSYQKNNSKKAYVKFVTYNKVKPNDLRELAKNIIKKSLDDNPNNELIFVLKSKPTNSILKISKEADYKICEFFWLNRLQFNITHHELVPKHIALSEEESKIILDRYKLNSIYQLPHISIQDPIVKYYNFKPGTICEIIRPSKTSVEYKFYRCVK